jgi:3-hydroxybutyryl-CoA dehydrogenase
MHEKLGIAGGGAIACGLAATASRHGEVVLWARSETSAAGARASVEKICGRLSGEVNASHVQVVTGLEELAGATAIVEAVVEDLAIKGPLLAQIAEVAAEDALICSTTSSLSVAALAAAAGTPERFVGLHVFNPVPRMKLVELAYPEEASDDTRARASALVAELEKESVDVPDLAGFVVNRLLFPYLFSAVDFMEQTGLPPASIDTCMQLGAAHPMGPIALLDYIGLDVSVAIGDAIEANVPQRLRDLCAEGALGRKAGRGLYPPEFYVR